MTPENHVVKMLTDEFATEILKNKDDDFQLSECKYFVKEECAQIYMRTTKRDDQIEIIQEAIFALQEKHGNKIISAIIFGSPLSGIKNLREAVTHEIIKRIDDDVNHEMRDAMTVIAENNFNDHKFSLCVSCS